MNSKAVTGTEERLLKFPASLITSKKIYQFHLGMQVYSLSAAPKTYTGFLTKKYKEIWLVMKYFQHLSKINYKLKPLLLS